MEASPRSPNQPMNRTVALLSLVPARESATGSILTMVRLTTAYIQVYCGSVADIAATMMPNRKKTIRLNSCCHPSANSALRAPASAKTFCTVRPASRRQ